MRIEARLFEILTGFFVLAAVAYGVLTAVFAYGGLEWAGTTALVLTAGLALIIGTFFRFIARRLDTRPEDYGDADIADGAGELGFFSPHSWWPILIALSFSTAAVGAALWGLFNQTGEFGTNVTKPGAIGCQYNYRNLRWVPGSPVGSTHLFIRGSVQCAYGGWQAPFLDLLFLLW